MTSGLRDHSVGVGSTPASFLLALFALPMFSIPWSRSFFLFYHLLSIFPYISSSSFGLDSDYHCLSYGVFSSSSCGLCPCLENWTTIFLSVSLRCFYFTFFVSALTGKVSWLSTFVAAWSIIVFLPKSAPFLLLESSCSSTEIFFPPRYRWFSLSYFHIYFSTATVAS